MPKPKPAVDMWQIHRTKEILTDHGLGEFLNRTYSYMGKSIKDIPYYEKRDDSEFRWSFIQPYLEEAETGLDIGCAEGYFANRMAEEGVITLGIERRPNKLNYGINQWGWKTNLGFANWEITPDTVHQLPTCDSLLLLTVYHHFISGYGLESAKNMLHTLGKKSDIIICEMPGNRLPGIRFEYQCTDVNTGETYKFTGFQQNIGRLRPHFEEHLPAGQYEVKVSAEDYKQSSSCEIKIGKSGQFRGERPRIRLEQDQIKLEQEEDESKIDDVVEWYKNHIHDVFDNQVDIIDETLTERVNHRKRKDIIYIIDTSSINSCLG